MLSGIQRIIRENTQRHRVFISAQSIIDRIQNESTENPAVALESCKSLIESIAKTILDLMPDASTSYNNRTDFHQLCKIAIEEVAGKSQADGHYLGVLLTFPNMMRVIGQVRSSAGEISHGQSYVDREEITEELSLLVIGITDVFCAHLLEMFFKQVPDIIIYEEETDFNTWLDEENPMDLGISYSRALYDQDPVAYEESLNDYYNEEDG